MNLSEAQISFENIVSNLSNDGFANFFKWIQNKYLVSGLLFLLNIIFIFTFH